MWLLFFSFIQAAAAVATSPHQTHPAVHHESHCNDKRATELTTTKRRLARMCISALVAHQHQRHGIRTI